MPYNTKQPIRSDLFKEIHTQIIGQVERSIQRYRDEMATRSVSGTFLVYTLLPFLTHHIESLSRVAGQRELNAEANAQFGSAGRDWVGEIEEIRDHLIIIRDAVDILIPLENGRIAVHIKQPNGAFSEVLFDTASTGPIVSLMNTLLQLFA